MLVSTTLLGVFRITCLQEGLWERYWGIRKRGRRNLKRQIGPHKYNLFHMTTFTALTPRYIFSATTICFILEDVLRTWTSRIIPHLSMFGVTSVNPRLNPNVWLLVTFLERSIIPHQTPRTETKCLFRQKVKKKIQNSCKSGQCSPRTRIKYSKLLELQSQNKAKEKTENQFYKPHIFTATLKK